MTIFLLIRHGENEYIPRGLMAGRLPGVHLTARGVEQAQSVAERLAGLPVAAVYSSPLERTVETAAPVAQKLNLPIVPRQGLIETDIGEWQGVELKALKRLKAWQTVQKLPSRWRFPSGETFSETQRRITRDLEELEQFHKNDKLVICVSHADPIKLAVAFFLGIPIDLFQGLEVGLASITALQLGKNANRLLTLNSNTTLNLPKH
jgi:probable phosphomutase (TIGR03848 family)